MSAYSPIPPYPHPDAPPAAPPARPRWVTVAFWLCLAAGVLQVVVTIVSAVRAHASRAQVSSTLSRMGTANGRQIDVNTVVTLGIVMSVVVGVIAVVVYVGLAFLIRHGYGWARIVLLIVAVLSLLGFRGADGLGALKAAVVVVATVLVFLSSSATWFLDMKDHRSPAALR